MLLLASVVFSPYISAHAEDENIRFIGGTCYTPDGKVYIQHGRYVMFDYESGLQLPLCMKPDCKHSGSGNRYDTFESFLMDTEVCYSQRVAWANGPLLLRGDQVYMVESSPDIFEERHSFDVWKSSIDGTGSKLISMGNLFSWNVLPECSSAILRNDDLFFIVHLSPNPYRQASPDDQRAGEEAILYRASVSTGSYEEILRLQDMYADITILEVTDDVLYYSYSLTSPYEHSVSLDELGFIFSEDFDEKSDAYYRELEEHTWGGIKGINYRTGETVVLDPSIERLNLKTSMQHMNYMISDNKLYLFLNPEITGSMDTEHSTFKVIDLLTGQELSSRKAPFYDPYNGFCPYYLLDEDHLFCYIFAPKGEYSIYNLVTEETIVLPLHNQFSAAQGEQPYDISSEIFQTEFIFFTPGNSTDSFFLTHSMILAGNYEPIPFDVLDW